MRSAPLAEDEDLRILAIAYACEPLKGSEPGTGWMWSRLLVRFGTTTVVTRRNNRDVIESALATTPEASKLEFVYVDLPRWARFWKKGKRGSRAYYMLWQFAALREARRMVRRSKIDIVWHVTFANFWLGSVGALLDAPFVLGPVGGGVRSSFNIRVVGMKGLLFELTRSLAMDLGRWANPLARLAWSRASLILVNNPETRDALPPRHRGKCVVFPHMVVDSFPDPDVAVPREPKTALFAGRLIGWKGGSLAIRAVARFPEWHLLICGKGPDERRLRRLARKLRVDERVDFLGWVGRADVHRLMRERAHVLVFPGIHEDGGWAGCEAVAHGLPVVCLDRGGPPIVAPGTAIAVGTVGDMTAGLAAAMAGARRTVPSRAWGIDARQRELLTVLERFNLLSTVE